MPMEVFPPPSGSVEDGLQAGCRVQVDGLQSALQHNGWQGIVLSDDEGDKAAEALQRGRKAVRLDSGQLLSLKPMNLRPVTYAVCLVEGRGMGVVATCDIKYGERLIAEPPLIVVSEGSELDAVAVVNNLPGTRRALFNSLHDAQVSGTPNHPFPHIFGIISTNAVSIDEDRGLSGVFGTISRFNHSCVPNVRYLWNDQLQAETVHACRDILCGEELCVSYMSVEASPGLCSPRDERRAKLKAIYGFVCSCQACTLGGKDLAASDRRRQAIFNLDALILQAIQCAQNERGELLVKERLHLLSEEQLEQPIVKQRSGYDAYQACKYAGLHDRARTWLATSADYALASGGADSGVYERYTRMLQRPVDAPHDPCHV